MAIGTFGIIGGDLTVSGQSRIGPIYLHEVLEVTENVSIGGASVFGSSVSIHNFARLGSSCYVDSSVALGALLSTVADIDIGISEIMHQYMAHQLWVVTC